MKTQIVKELITAKDKVQYEEYVTRVLSNRYILAWIIKGTLEKFKDWEPHRIALECIEPDIFISSVSVSPEAAVPDAIIGQNTEDKVPGEGMITYDIRFKVRQPESGDTKNIVFLVNVEAQKSYHRSYAIVTRGIFYAARMLSGQLDREFKIPHYNDLKKVYSIWICMNSPKDFANSIAEYCLEKHNLIGKIPVARTDYDKLSVILICMNSKILASEPGLLHLLGTLLSPKIRIEKKKEILDSHYSIPLEDDLGKELDEMCNLSEAIEEEALETGIKQGRAQGWAQMKQALKLAAEGRSYEEIAKALELPVDTIRHMLED